LKPGEVLGLIPARGGSKGIPRKNLLWLAGRPLLGYTIEAALGARTLKRVIVSTDDAEIAGVAKQCGAEVPFLRPPEYATDTASSISVIHHALSWLERNEGYRPRGVALLAPTCPLRGAAQIDGTVELWRASGLDSAVTVYPFEKNPYAVYTRQPDGRLVEVFEMARRPQRRQDLPPYFTHSQAVMVSSADYLASVDDSAPVVHWGSSVGFEIDRVSGFDIDAPTDLLIAEALMRQSP